MSRVLFHHGDCTQAHIFCREITLSNRNLPGQVAGIGCRGRP